MSHDVLARLNGLRDEVRARIEATTDYLALMTVEKAIGELKSLLPEPVAAAEAVAQPAIAEISAAPEAAAPTAVEAESAPAEASQAEAPGETTEAAATSTELEAAAEEAPAASAELEAASEPAAEAAAETAVETPAVEVKVPEIPAEDRPLVAELVAAAAELPATASTTAAN
jgi:hypothetical protein